MAQRYRREIDHLIGIETGTLRKTDDGIHDYPRLNEN